MKIQLEGIIKQVVFPGKTFPTTKQCFDHIEGKTAMEPVWVNGVKTGEQPAKRRNSIVLGIEVLNLEEVIEIIKAQFPKATTEELEYNRYVVLNLSNSDSDVSKFKQFLSKANITNVSQLINQVVGFDASVTQNKETGKVGVWPKDNSLTTLPMKLVKMYEADGTPGKLTPSMFNLAFPTDPAYSIPFNLLGNKAAAFVRASESWESKEAEIKEAGQYKEVFIPGKAFAPKTVLSSEPGEDMSAINQAAAKVLQEQAEARAAEKETAGKPTKKASKPAGGVGGALI